MARFYTAISMVASNNAEEFTSKLNKKIAELQYPAEGKYVEVQFQTNMNQATALVLQYKEV
jgi:hypothetical protein